MSRVASALNRVRESLPANVTLVAVSKFHPLEQLQEAYDAGQRDFGESRVQELIPKIEAMPGDVRWHFIGHLQTNKVRSLIGRIHLIHSVDSLHLLELIDRESERAGVITHVLMQAHVAAEETKTGFDPAELLGYFASRGHHTLRATHIDGLMGMATNTDDTARITADFNALHDLWQSIRRSDPELRGFDILSMGMSDDRDIAVSCGSTMVRVGSDIFGPRL